MNKKIIAGIFTFSLLFTVCASPAMTVYADDDDSTVVEAVEEENDPIVNTGYSLPTSDCVTILMNRYRYCNDVEDVGLIYGTDKNLENDVETKEVNSYFSVFSAVLSDLEPGTTYYYRAYANTADGMILGEIKSFKTLNPRNVTTGNASSITATSATIKSNSYKNVSLAYRCGVGFDTEETDVADRRVSTFSRTSFSVKLNKLEPDTTYYYYTYVSTLFGNTFKGELKSFTTLPE